MESNDPVFVRRCGKVEHKQSEPELFDGTIELTSSLDAPFDWQSWGGEGID